MIDLTACTSCLYLYPLVFDLFPVTGTVAFAFGVYLWDDIPGKIKGGSPKVCLVFVF